MKSFAKLKKELDTIFSQYIRWYYADDTGMVQCFTCGVVKPVKQMQNGHFRSRKHLNTRWDTRNCRPQCVKCNMYDQGRQYDFGIKLQQELGKDIVDEVIKLSHQSTKLTKNDLIEMIKFYKNEMKDL